jgi:hypothetical protein
MDDELSESQHLSFLLRLWTVKTPAGVLWRASLESPLTFERIGFSDLETLFTYLEKTAHARSCQDISISERDEP